MTNTGWLGRQPKGLQDSNSFKVFLAKASQTKEGLDHIRRHHGGNTKPSKA